jgi:hypothetical protein
MLIFSSKDQGGDMSILDQDYHPYHFTERREVMCEICKQPCVLHHDNSYCDECQERIDREEQEAETVRDLPILRPIAQRPVELNAVLWQEWKQSVSKRS